jgi:hypothetical protein
MRLVRLIFMAAPLPNNVASYQGVSVYPGARCPSEPVAHRIFESAVDPNGVITASKPAFCYGVDAKAGWLWVKTGSGYNNTGWTAQIAA